MQNNLGVLALVLGATALGLSGYALIQGDADDAGLGERIALLERQVDDLQTAVAEQDETHAQVPSLMGHSLESLRPAGGGSGTAPRGAKESAASTVAGGSTEEAMPTSDASEATADEIEAMVDRAVAKKAEQIMVMRNKKPSADVFARTLELDEEQRASMERQVVDAQNQIRDLLRTRTADGTDLLEELVEVMAEGIANPGQNQGAGAKWFQRVMTEKVPGTDQTYAMRAEAVKATLRQGFQREWRPEQYKRFEEWKMDPTEVQGIEGSPWKEVERLVRERARQLGAEFPDER
jgi:hypothetical protein